MHPVDGDIWHGGKQDFPRALDASGPANMWRFPQGADFLVQLAHRRLPVARVMDFQVIADALHVLLLVTLCATIDGGRRPPDAHSGAKHFFKTLIHLVFFDKFVPIGAGFGFENGGAEVGVVREPHGGVLDQKGRVCADNPRGLNYLRFLLQREMDFHVLSVTENALPVKGEVAAPHIKGTACSVR